MLGTSAFIFEISYSRARRDDPGHRPLGDDPFDLGLKLRAGRLRC